MIRLNSILAIFVVVFAQVWAGDDVEGGYGDVDIRDPHVKTLADLVVVDYNVRSNSEFYQPLVEILGAKKGRGLPKNQYVITLLLGKSSCPKNMPPDILQTCRPSLEDKHVIEALVTEDLDGVVREKIYYKDIPLHG